MAEPLCSFQVVQRIQYISWDELLFVISVSLASSEYHGYEPNAGVTGRSLGWHLFNQNQRGIYINLPSNQVCVHSGVVEKQCSVPIECIDRLWFAFKSCSLKKKSLLVYVQR